MDLENLTLEQIRKAIQEEWHCKLGDNMKAMLLGLVDRISSAESKLEDVSATIEGTVNLYKSLVKDLEDELEAIKKQGPLCVVENKNLAKLADGKKAKVYGCAPHMLYNPDYHSNLFAKPVYQHSFTVDGHTFYADNEVDILYLERKFGVGGKAKLNLVEDK